MQGCHWKCRRAHLWLACALLLALPWGWAAATDVAARTGPAIIGMQVQGSGRLAHGQRVPLPRVLQALGAPSQREPSPYECGSAYDEGDTQLLSWAGQAWESEGRTAVLRRFDVGREGALLLANGTQIGARTSPADVLQRVPRAHRSGDTVHVTPDPRGLTEERYDLRFDGEGRLFQIDYWIAC